MKQLDDKKFLFKEDRIVNPETKETEVFEMEINLEKYEWYEIMECCKSFGYTAAQVDDWLNTGREFALIAECIFEMEV
jgi:hypothetical protein